MARLKNGRGRRTGGPTERATSCGGIIVRQASDGPEIVLGRRNREGDRVTWSLPKGTPDKNESTEQTALREVTEETGLEVRISRPLDSIEYWFVQDGTRIHKTVNYYLMDPTGGDLGRHDHEFESVRWIGFDEAQHLLTFETERTLVARAADEIAGRDTPNEAGPVAPAGHGA